MEDAFFKEKLNELKQIDDGDVVSVIESIESNPGYFVNWVILSTEFFDLGRMDDALEIIEHAIGLDSNVADFWAHKGLILGVVGNHKEAIKCIKKALDMDPDRVELWVIIADYYLLLGDGAKALETINHGIEINSKVSKLWANKGNILITLNPDSDDFKEVLECFDNALKLGSEDDMTLYDLSMGYALIDHYSEALDAINQAISINPDCSEYWFSKGMILHDIENFQGAITSINNGIEIGDPDFNALRALADSYFYLGFFDNALDAVNDALKLEKEDSGMWLLKGNILNEMGKSKESFACIIKSFELSSDDLDN